ncbi:MAG: ribonuclease P protein component [Chloroflexota bacterium]|nr:ribonuclease P protein component [Chloroflexota bacterium]
MYDRPQRLRASREWRQVRRRGRCVRGTYTSFCVMPVASEERYGFSTSKGFRRAVDRNRARRRLREAFRSVYQRGPSAIAVVGTATPESLALEYTQLQAEVASQLRQLQLSVHEGMG